MNTYSADFTQKRAVASVARAVGLNDLADKFEASFYGRLLRPWTIRTGPIGPIGTAWASGGGAMPPNLLLAWGATRLCSPGARTAFREGKETISWRLEGPCTGTK